MTDERDQAIDRFYGEVGQLVQAARTQAGLSQTDLGDRIGLTRSSIANLEAGRQRIRLHILALIADALRMKLSELITDTPLGIKSSELSQVDEFLSGSPDSARRFVEGVISQLDNVDNETNKEGEQ
ncbi:helix-turn-helix transcriptional regulator [Amycolatopsis sp. NPDC051102]|uniref:helix-turn-helix domain-containing protein n=1 Tax=Amycolatopsis sp. NPDC051102 TaxID=3155163 RepID=UPI0034390FD2